MTDRQEWALVAVSAAIFAYTFYHSDILAAFLKGLYGQ